MVKLKYFVLFLFCLLAPSSFASDILTCNFKSSCDTDETAFIYANQNFNTSSGLVLSSNVAISSYVGYSKPLCCKVNIASDETNLAKLNVSYIPTSTVCPNGFEDLMYLTSNENARVGITQNITDFSHYSHKMCVGIPTQFSKLNILVSTNDYTFAGYDCLYRISNVTNGVISDCSATFNGVSTYPNKVWAKLTENVDSLKCNEDCTSKLDGRVYSSCGSKIVSCNLVSPQCDGSIYGSYVKDSTGNYEIECSAPWTNIRNLAFTNQKVEVVSTNNKCSNIIQTKYSAMLNNELVSMMVYVCKD